MKINYNVQGKARGKLVKIIAEALNQESTYLKAPTYNYEIGAFTITREGELEFDIADVTKDEIQTAVDAAKAAGFEVAEIDGEPAPEVETDGEDSPEISAETEEGGGLSIAFPLEGFTPQTLDNLEKMVIAKGELIKAALGAENLPIITEGEEVKFPWFAKCEHSEMLAYAQFIECLCKTAQAKTRVTATAPESYDNPRFSMRVWLISLGMRGGEYALSRKLLMSKLDGNSGWRYEDKQPRNPRNGERVQKEVVSVRFTAEMLDKLAELASQSNMSRNQLIESVVCEYVQTELPESEVQGEDSSEIETPDTEESE